MPKEYDNTNRGAIWPNDRQETERHPDFTGSLNVEGKEYWVSAWKKKPDASDKAPVLSFSVKAKDAGGRKGPPPTATQNDPGGHFDDSIPF